MATLPNDLQIVVFSGGTLQFFDHPPEQVPADGFVWIFLSREVFDAMLPTVQATAQKLGGSRLIDLHCKDIRNQSHPSDYDYTSIYDLVVFQRLATEDEARRETATSPAASTLGQVSTKGVAFAIFDRLLISVHPEGCFTARTFLQRYLADAVQSEGLSTASARSRLPDSPADLMLRMANLMVDSSIELRRKLGDQIEQWQTDLLKPGSPFSNWIALMGVRNELHALEDLCDGQQSAMHEWLEALREQPLGAQEQGERDALVARLRDVIEHIDRVVRHARRMEQSAETVVQIHFNLQGHRTNDVMRTLTALTAIFLPLNLLAGIFGMNFIAIPLARRPGGFWIAVGTMVVIAAVLSVVFWRKHYLARSTR
ncbi:MAG: magnesium transporter CorA family protein [Variovorax sp.]